jgi:hypothetical protein
MLSAFELSSMRAEAERAMPDSMVVVTRTGTTTASGEQSYTSSNSTAQPCQLVGLAGSERLIADRIRSDASWKLVYPTSVELTVQSQVIIGDRTLEVLQVVDQTEWSITNIAFLKEIA